MAEDQSNSRLYDRGDGESVLAWAAGNRVLHVSKNNDGTFDLSEACDNHFYVTLTVDELRELAQELMALADK